MIQKWMRRFTKRLQIWVDSPWYPVFIFCVGFLDVFLFVIPSDGILISSALARPQRWVTLAVAISIGTTLGGIIFAALIQAYGINFIHEHMPQMLDSWAWQTTDVFFKDYGLWVLFICAATPLSIQPGVFFSVMAGIPLVPIVGVLIVGRLIKNGILGGVAALAPQYLERLWGVGKELEEVGLSQMPEDKNAKR